MCQLRFACRVVVYGCCRLMHNPVIGLALGTAGDLSLALGVPKSYRVTICSMLETLQASGSSSGRSRHRVRQG